MKKVLFIIVLLAAAIRLSAAERQIFTCEYGGETRTFWLYIPDCAGENAPLVMLLHGYGGKADKYCPAITEVADKEGFAVCFPQGEKDYKGKPFWNVGYAFHKDVTRDDVGFLVFLTDYVCENWKLDRRNCFFSGMSNGGEMSYLMAHLHPEAYNAFAPIAGLTMEWTYKQLKPKAAVPLMEVHGTADKTSLWEGDPTNEGGWGEYSSVPDAVGRWINEARCKKEVVTNLPKLSEESNQVILHRYINCRKAWKGGPRIEVRLYEVIGGKHSWAMKDMDTCQEMWDFFKLYLK